MDAHAHLKNELTEDEKYHNLMTWLNCNLMDGLGIYIFFNNISVTQDNERVNMKGSVQGRAI